MRSGIPLLRAFGVQIRVHPSWFIIFALVVLSLGTLGSPLGDIRLSPLMTWLRALIVAALFFASVIVHELAHALVARRRGLVIKEITLFIFGGAANLEQESPNARTEALVAGAGPVSSVVLGAACVALALVLGGRGPEITQVVADAALWLGSINLMLAVFNLIPGFPMDGGRLLRALVWGVTKDFLRATRVATAIGRAFAYVLIGLGFFIALSGSVIEGLWLAFIGWFLNQAAEASYRRVALEKLVEGIHVRDVMDRDVPVVGPNLTLDTLVDQHLLSGEAHLYPVTQDGELVGTVEIAQVSRVPRNEWPHTRVTDVMSRGERLNTLTEPQPLWEALQRFQGSAALAIPVVDEETKRRFLGLVSRDGVFRALRAREKLRS